MSRAVERYLHDLDKALPGAVVGLYVVGSVALGAYREGRSDIDFVAVLDDDSGPNGLRRLRRVQVRSGLRTATSAVGHGRSPLSGTCNGVFVRRRDLPLPVSDITPVASYSGSKFRPGHAGSDVGPVAWKVLAERGIAVRGPDASSLELDPQSDLLPSWNLGNLDDYWRPWATGVARAPGARFRLRPRWSTAWGALGAPRLHHTLMTGEVISKEAAGEYALDVFATRWQPVVLDALAYWRREPDRLHLPREERGRLTAEFVLEVIEDAHKAAAAGAG